VAVPPAPVCRTCGAPAEPAQEYCLECGNRLVPARGAPSLATWIIPSLLALLVAAAGAAAAIAATRGTTKGTRTLVAVSPLRPAPAPPAPKKARPKPTARPKGVRKGLISWPAGNGYTIVLATLPLAQGASAARAQALQALKHGLPHVGILVSSSYPSLQPGYYIVFSGIFPSLQEAQSSLDAAKAFFPSASARPIAR
jgi:hypothetical protein